MRPSGYGAANFAHFPHVITRQTANAINSHPMHIKEKKGKQNSQCTHNPQPPSPTNMLLNSNKLRKYRDENFLIKHLLI